MAAKKPPHTDTVTDLPDYGADSEQTRVYQNRAAGLNVFRGIQEFAHQQTSGGIVLMICTIIALIWANSPWGHEYVELFHSMVDIHLGSHEVLREALHQGGQPFTLHHFINDALMAVFFFVVGLEVKREVMVGELSSPRQAALPIAGAIGGMLLPAILYATVNLGQDSIGGWGIPMATDIAFALGILAIMGRGTPVGLKVFLAALAIADDIGAVLVIAFFYTSEVSLGALGLSAIVFAMLWGLNFIGTRSPIPYALLGIVMWFLFLYSGVHATIAGILVALTIPAKPRIRKTDFMKNVERLMVDFRRVNVSGASTLQNHEQQELLAELESASAAVSTPLSRLEHALHPWISFGILPLFALANAGVVINASALTHLLDPLAIGIIVGLVIGKPLGIMLLSWLSIKAGLADLSPGVTWKMMFGVSCLAGIGFTMSLFIAALAFPATSPMHETIATTKDAISEKRAAIAERSPAAEPDHDSPAEEAAEHGAHDAAHASAAADGHAAAGDSGGHHGAANPNQDIAKLAILVASIISGIIGAIALKMATAARKPEDDGEEELAAAH